VEYWGITYCDAQQIDKIWHYEDAFGGVHDFFRQDWGQPITGLSETRRHPPHLSGQAVVRSSE
jgi:hypothetical protein